MVTSNKWYHNNGPKVARWCRTMEVVTEITNKTAKVKTHSALDSDELTNRQE